METCVPKKSLLCCVQRNKKLFTLFYKHKKNKAQTTFWKVFKTVDAQRGLGNEYVASNETPSANVISTEVMLTSRRARRSAVGRADESDA